MFPCCGAWRDISSVIFVTRVSISSCVAVGRSVILIFLLARKKPDRCALEGSAAVDREPVRRADPQLLDSESSKKELPASASSVLAWRRFTPRLGGTCRGLLIPTGVGAAGGAGVSARLGPTGPVPVVSSPPIMDKYVS